MWNNQNKESHDEFEERMNKCEAEKLQHKITDEYNKDGSNIMIQHRYLLKESLENVYKKMSKKKNIGRKLFKQVASVMKYVLQSSIKLQEQLI